MKTIRGKKALVTGASSGIGRAIALALANEGASVGLLGRDPVKLETAAGEVRGFGVEAMVIPCDVSKPEQTVTAIQNVLAQWGRIDILINSAGINYYGPTEFMTDDQASEILDINLFAPIRIMRQLLPAFLKQNEAHILNVSSIFGLVTMRKGAVYQTTKFGLVAFSNALRAEYSRDGVGVTVLCPGFVRTPMLENYMSGPGWQKRHRVPDWACSSPEHVAKVAIRAIRRNKGLVVISPMARAMWWMTRVSPAFYDFLMREGWRKWGGRRSRATD